MTTKTGLKLGNGAQVKATMIVWPIERLSEVISNLSQNEKDALNYRLGEKRIEASAKCYHTLVEVEEITGYSYSSPIPITMPETANAILQAFRNETNYEMGHHFRVAHTLPPTANPLFFEGKVFPEAYLMALSMVQNDLMGDGDNPFITITEQEPPRPASPVPDRDAVTSLCDHFDQLWTQFCEYLPEGDYRVSPVSYTHLTLPTICSV